MKKTDMKILTLLIILATILSTHSCNNEKPESKPFERYITDEGVRSAILKRDISYSILLPKDYDKNTDKRYPVVYMLHGYGDDHNSWNGQWLHAEQSIKSLENNGLSDMIYVFPQGFNTYYCNFHTGAFNYMDMFIEEMIPTIDATYRTIPDRQHRCITGYSMGGFGAMVLAEQHPEAFLCSAPLSMSFRTDAQYMAEPQSGWDNQWGNIFGGKGEMGTRRLTDYYKQHCPYYYFNDENRAALSTVKWYFTCGDDEENLLYANDSLHVVLRDRNFAHEFRVANGAHTSSYWMTALSEVLPMFDYYINGGEKWPGISMETPSFEEVELESDGCFVSSKYKTEGTGKVVYLFHDSHYSEMLPKILSLIQAYKLSAYAIVPCDVNNKGIASVIATYNEKYPATEKIAFGIGKGGQYAMLSEGPYAAYYLIDASIETFELASDAGYYFACTDESEGYGGMFELYKACRRAGNSFEYRVLNASGEKENDTLRLIKELKQYLKL